MVPTPFIALCYPGIFPLGSQGLTSTNTFEHELSLESLSLAQHMRSSCGPSVKKKNPFV